MLDINLIDNTIEELEQGDTNFNTCEKLANLYIIKAYYKPSISSNESCSNEIKKELSDILPSYEKYCNCKRRYQLGQTQEEEVIYDLKLLGKEISEFILTLYAGTNLQTERTLIIEELQSIYNKLNI